MTFECGRNKRASILLGDVDAAADREGPSPADTTKLAREINHAALPLGYALDFYDDDHGEAERLTERVREWISMSKCDGLRIIVLRRREALGTIFAGIMGRAAWAGVRSLTEAD